MAAFVVLAGKHYYCKMKLLFYISAALWFFSSASLQAQDTTFLKAYDWDNAPDVGSAVIGLNDGYVICGFGATARTDGWGTVNVVRTDTLGEVIWKRAYGASKATHSVHGNQCFVELVNGGYAIFGSYYDSVINNVQGLLLRIDENGDSLWKQTYGYAGHRYFFIGGKETPDHGFIMVGYKQLSPTQSTGHVWVVKTDSLGVMEWDTIYANGAGFGMSVQLNSDGTYAIGGQPI